MSKSKEDPCGVCNLREKTNSVLCAQCGKWMHGRCASENGDHSFQEIWNAENVKEILERQWNIKKIM